MVAPEGGGRPGPDECKSQTLPGGAESRRPPVTKQEASVWALRPPLDVGRASSHAVPLGVCEPGVGTPRPIYLLPTLNPGGRWWLIWGLWAPTPCSRSSLSLICYLLGVPEAIVCRSTKKGRFGTSLVAQWLRIRLPMQRTWVRGLVWEDPTCRGATRPVSHNY